MSVEPLPVLVSPPSTVSAGLRSRQLRRSEILRRARKSRRPGSISKSFDVATCQSGRMRVGFGAPREQSASNGRRYRRRNVRQHLPLWHLCSGSGSGSSMPPSATVEEAKSNGCGRDCDPDHAASQATKSAPSPASQGLSRRVLLRAGAAAGGGFMLGLRLPFPSDDGEAVGADISRLTPSSGFERNGQIA